MQANETGFDIEVACRSLDNDILSAAQAEYDRADKQAKEKAGRVHHGRLVRRIVDASAVAREFYERLLFANKRLESFFQSVL